MVFGGNLIPSRRPTQVCTCQALEMFGLDLTRDVVVRLQVKPQTLCGRRRNTKS
jgi:hypothetical protein